MRGISTCGSVWSCPCCQAPIQALRAQEVGRLVAWAEEAGHVVVMLTLTVRHAWTHELARTMAGVAEAWRMVQRGAPWLRWREDVGLVGTVRALEVTHGSAGWHPHLHVLAVLRRPDVEPFDLRPDAEIGATMAHALFDPRGDRAEWLALRWQACVDSVLGWRSRPDLEHGFDVQPARSSSYLSKLGLEIGSSGTKRGGDDGHRDPWAIARDATQGDVASARLWRDFSSASHGRRQLTWSRGLKRLAGVAVVTDQAAAALEHSGPALLVANLEPREWAAVLRAHLVPALLEAAERDPPRARALIRALFRPPDD